MKKHLLILAIVVAGLVSGCVKTESQTQTIQTKTNILVSDMVVFDIEHLNNYVFYIKDTNATPPLCYFVSSNGAGGGPTVVPCENLKHYFPDKLSDAIQKNQQMSKERATELGLDVDMAE